MLQPFVNSVVGLVEYLGESESLSSDALLGDVEDFSFGSFQELFGRHALVVGVTQDFGAGVDQTADKSLVADNLGIIFGVGGGRGGIPQLGQVVIAPHVIDLFLLLQIVGQGDQIDGFALIEVEGMDCLKDFLMVVGVKVVDMENLNDVVDGVIVAQHTAENTALGVAVVRQKAFLGPFFVR